jgi:predicted MFS family arabinose efflux permease
VRRGAAVDDPKLAPLAVELARKQLEMNQGRKLFVVAAALIALLLVVTVLQGEWIFAVVCVALLGFFGWWLAAGQQRRNAQLQRAIDANEALVAGTKRKRG